MLFKLSQLCLMTILCVTGAICGSGDRGEHSSVPCVSDGALWECSTAVCALPDKWSISGEQIYLFIFNVASIREKVFASHLMCFVSGGRGMAVGRSGSHEGVAAWPYGQRSRYCKLTNTGTNIFEILISQANSWLLCFSGAVSGSTRLGYCGDDTGWNATKQNHDAPPARHIQPVCRQPWGLILSQQVKLEGGHFMSKLFFHIVFICF